MWLMVSYLIAPRNAWKVGAVNFQKVIQNLLTLLTSTMTSRWQLPTSVMNQYQKL